MWRSCPDIGELNDESAESVVNDDRDCNLQGKITLKKVEKTFLQGQIQGLKNRCYSIQV